MFGSCCGIEKHLHTHFQRFFLTFILLNCTLINLWIHKYSQQSQSTLNTGACVLLMITLFKLTFLRGFFVYISESSLMELKMN